MLIVETQTVLYNMDSNCGGSDIERLWLADVLARVLQGGEVTSGWWVFILYSDSKKALTVSTFTTTKENYRNYENSSVLQLTKISNVKVGNVVDNLTYEPGYCGNFKKLLISPVLISSSLRPSQVESSTMENRNLSYVTKFFHENKRESVQLARNLYLSDELLKAGPKNGHMPVNINWRLKENSGKAQWESPISGYYCSRWKLKPRIQEIDLKNAFNVVRKFAALNKIEWTLPNL